MLCSLPHSEQLRSTVLIFESKYLYAFKRPTKKLGMRSLFILGLGGKWIDFCHDEHDLTAYLASLIYVLVIVSPWSSSVKGESLAYQITSPFNKKIGCFCKEIFLILFSKTTQLIVEWGSYLASQ